jgi:hypothetical protein
MSKIELQVCYNKREEGIYEIETVNLFLTEEPECSGISTIGIFSIVPSKNEFFSLECAMLNVRN